MRLLLTLQCRKGSLIPLNYQYLISAWIYKVLGKANADFSYHLHNTGYAIDGKQFKLFTYGRLEARPYEILSKQGLMRVDSEEVKLMLSFWVDDAMQNFVMGLFQDQHIGIGNKLFAPVDFYIKQVQMLPKPAFHTTMRYETVMGIVISQQKESDKYAQYLSPLDKDYQHLLLQNLAFKALAYGNPVSLNQNIAFNLLTSPKDKLITIKEGTAQETKIRAYHYRFEFTAPIALQEAAYYAGFGEDNSQGLGMVNIVRF